MPREIYKFYSKSEPNDTYVKIKELLHCKFHNLWISLYNI